MVLLRLLKQTKLTVQGDINAAYGDFVSFMHTELDKCAKPTQGVS